MEARLSFVTLGVADLARATAFYRDVLQLPQIAMPDGAGVAFFELGHTWLSLYPRAALAADAAVLVFPGGDEDVYRPTRAETVIDFAGRTGYVTAAAAAGAPIVPMVSIGGQETQLYLSRGTWLARALGLTKLERRLFRTDILPISFGFPFGLSVLIPVNMPLPAKIVTEVLAPIDVPATDGEPDDITAVDAHVRRVMQTALHRLARRRRVPLLG